MSYSLDPSLVFPVPEDGSQELEYLAAGPEMSGDTKPIWEGIYIRFNSENQEWEYDEFMDGYWATTGIFMHQHQNFIWRGAILKATQQMIDEIEQLKGFLE